ncbi:hypothetical protein A0H81_07974 [Grifola frondosa]|uniref:DUF6589 domain-containing protein n=1 Tax=Grifola frondosa TaxID=5627 RepID=A0A1C7M7K9_GRIFR|nr:hypothetical protein A0H81_07974 [Grifola frondosa]
MIKTTVVISILMQSTNQQCNMLSSVIGIFLHSCNTPEKVVKTLAHMGIHSRRHPFSFIECKSYRETRTVLRSICIQQLRCEVEHTCTNSRKVNENLLHLPLVPSSILIMYTTEYGACIILLPFILKHHIIRIDIVGNLMHGNYSMISVPMGQIIEQYQSRNWSTCPHEQWTQSSKVSGNIEAIANLLHQGGVGDPSEVIAETATGEQEVLDVLDISDRVIIIHGDLGTSERDQSILKQQAIESTPWRRYQFVIFVMDSFIPQFRQLHEVIMHAGLALRLDSWRVEAQKRNRDIKTLEDLANKRPTLEALEEIANRISQDHIAGEGLDMFRLRNMPVSARDQQRENTVLLQQYLLLYERMTYAMNAGDIGMVEAEFPAWIALFKVTGKHKYATQMIRFLTDLHFVYPEKLRTAIRYNMLVNPTGKPHHSRGVDWVIELINLYTKDMYGGEGPNYTKNRIITESPLVLLFRSAHANIERNFRLSGLTFAHAQKDISQTLKNVLLYLQEAGPNEFKAGRKTAHVIKDMLRIGEAMVEADTEAKGNVFEDDIDSTNELLTAEDLSVEDAL